MASAWPPVPKGKVGLGTPTCWCVEGVGPEPQLAVPRRLRASKGVF